MRPAGLSQADIPRRPAGLPVHLPAPTPCQGTVRNPSGSCRRARPDRFVAS